MDGGIEAGPHIQAYEREMTAKPTLIDRSIAVLETELDLLVEEYHGVPMSLPSQRIAEVFGRYFALECLRAYGVSGFQYASAGFTAILDML
jgi:hypothetical protein